MSNTHKESLGSGLGLTYGQQVIDAVELKYPRNKDDWQRSIHAVASHNFNMGRSQGRQEIAASQQYDVTQAKIQIMREAAALAQANAKLTYALSQIIGEKKGFGA